MTKQEKIKTIVDELLTSNNSFVDVPIEIMPKIAEALYNACYGKVEEYNAEIKRLTERERLLENALHTSIEHTETVERDLKASESRNAELQKQVDELKKRLHLIWAIGVDYDGCNKIKSLKELIDEMVELTQIESKNFNK